MFNSKNNLEYHKKPLQPFLISLTDTAKALNLKNTARVRAIINSNKITKGVYKIGARTIRINLPEFLENFKQTQE